MLVEGHRSAVCAYVLWPNYCVQGNLRIYSIWCWCVLRGKTKVYSNDNAYDARTKSALAYQNMVETFLKYFN